ncbi:hypothetical protein JCM11251_003958 [Rhodosporidiobolus azoricus]
MPASNDLLHQMAALAIQGQTVLITGASGGIGRAIASVFRQSGCNLILLGTDAAKLKTTVAELPKGESDVWSYVCDLRKRKDVKETIEKTVKECKPVDILINNAGYALHATRLFWEQDLDDVASVMDVNVSGLMTITHAVLRQHMMRREPQPKGTIVNISSITGHQAPLKEGYETSYHTSKVKAFSLCRAAVEGFSNILRHETIGTNIRVLVHRPGTTHTEFHTRRVEYNADKTAAIFDGMGALHAEDLAVGVLWQCIQPERVSVVLMETLATAQRSNYAIDKEWEKRNGKH